MTLATAIVLGTSFVASTAVSAPASLTAETVGIVKPTGKWHLDFDGQNVQLWFGGRSDQPLLGDWDCDDIDTPAVYRANGRIYLTNDNVTGVASDTLFFGTKGDIAVAGDWDGDGCDSFGVYRPSEAKFYLSNALTTGPAEIDFFFGGDGDLPLAGDWDGDGSDSVGVYRPDAGTAYLTNGIVTATADTTVPFGEPGDIILSGDWDGDGVDALGALRTADDTVRLLGSIEGPDETTIATGGLVGTPVSGLLERVVTVAPVGSALENGAELRRAADYVADQSPTSGRPWTIRVAPGTYDLSATIPGVELPPFTSLAGTAGAADTVLVYEVFGPSGAAVLAQSSSRLAHFTIEADFGFASGTGIDAVGDTEVEDVVVKIDTTRSAEGIVVRGTTTVSSSTLDIRSSRTAVPIRVEATGEVSVSATTITAHGSFTGAIGFSNSGNASIAGSTITVTAGAFGTPCSGIINLGGELNITDSDITVCTEPLGGPNPPEPGTGVNVEAGPVNIVGGTINASQWSIQGTANVTVTDTELGAPVSGPVTCTNTVYGFAVFPDNCPGQPILYRINAGGEAIELVDGTAQWTSDLLVPPSPFVNFDLVSPGNIASHTIATLDASIPPGTPPEIFESERWDAEELPEMTWRFPVPYNLPTEVRLYFSSGFDGASLPGDRVFDVLIDGVLVLDDYDIVADVGHSVGTMKVFFITTDIDGIDIEFRHTEASADNPQVNGLEVLVSPAR